jgi:hypothetical protein
MNPDGPAIIAFPVAMLSGLSDESAPKVGKINVWVLTL